MCGIVGVAGWIGQKEERAFTNMLIVDSLRGIHSTGVATVRRNSEDTHVAKEIGDPFRLFETRRFEKAFAGMNRVLIGHNRFATQGAVTARNAHPFDFDTLIGVHNGTLKNKYRLEDAASFQVDSENLYHHMEKKGLRDLLDTMDGAWTLVWWDKQKNTINFLRNQERPLYMLTSKDGRTLFWASESWMLTHAAGREVDMSDRVVSLEQDFHMSIEILKDGSLTKPVMVEAKAKPFIYTPSTYFPNHGKQQQAPFVDRGRLAPSQGASVQTGNVFQNTATVQKTDTTTGTKDNVLPFEPSKKKEEASSSEPKKFYVNSKGVTFELVSLDTDTHGAKYIRLMDDENPDKDVRLYLPRTGADHLIELTGTGDGYIIGDIKDIRIHKSEGTYYKVGYNTIAVVEFDKGSDEDEEEKYIDHRGKYITYKEHINRYGTCSMCTGFVDPDNKGTRFTTEGDPLCHECAVNPAVLQCVSIVH